MQPVECNWIYVLIQELSLRPFVSRCRVGTKDVYRQDLARIVSLSETDGLFPETH